MVSACENGLEFLVGPLCSSEELERVVSSSATSAESRRFFYGCFPAQQRRTAPRWPAYVLSDEDLVGDDPANSLSLPFRRTLSLSLSPACLSRTVGRLSSVPSPASVPFFVVGSGLGMGKMRDTRSNPRVGSHSGQLSTSE